MRKNGLLDHGRLISFLYTTRDNFWGQKFQSPGEDVTNRIASPRRCEA